MLTLPSGRPEARSGPPPLFLATYGMNPVSSPSRKLAIEQARTVRSAQAAGRTLQAWSAALADGHTIVVFAVTDRAARSVASVAGAVLRVGPAAVRDLAGAVARILAAVPAPSARVHEAPSPVPVVSSRDSRRDWLASGEGRRPVFSSPSVVRRSAGEPRKAMTARCRPAAGAPIASEYSLGGSARPVRLAHESRPARAYTPEWNPGLPLFSVA